LAPLPRFHAWSLATYPTTDKAALALTSYTRRHLNVSATMIVPAPREADPSGTMRSLVVVHDMRYDVTLETDSLQ